MKSMRDLHPVILPLVTVLLAGAGCRSLQPSEAGARRSVRVAVPPIGLDTPSIRSQALAAGELAEVLAGEAWSGWTASPGRGGGVLYKQSGTPDRYTFVMAATRADRGHYRAGFDGEHRPFVLSGAASVERPQRNPDRQVAGRGLYIHLSSLTPESQERTIADRLLASGWTVLRIDPPQHRRADAIPSSADGSTDTAGSGEVHDPMVATAALMTDLLLAHTAGFAVAVVDDLRARAAVSGQDAGPVVVGGFSYGALAAPLLAAHLGDDLDAAVLVGGGADISQTIAGRQLARDGLKFDSGPANARYRAIVRADPLHMAPALRGPAGPDGACTHGSHRRCAWWRRTSRPGWQTRALEVSDRARRSVPDARCDCTANHRVGRCGSGR